MASFVTDSDLFASLANILKLDATALPSWWADIVNQSNIAAAQDVTTRLMARNFTVAQINGFDRGAELQKAIALYYALTMGGAAADFDSRFIDRLDRRGELSTITVTVGGLIQAPGGAVAVTEATATPFTFGYQSTGTDLFIWDTDDPRQTDEEMRF